MHHHWRDLLFLHKSFDPEEMRRLVPEGLEIDTFPDEQGNERAWLGLVPFRMFGIRGYAMPAAPGLNAFPETNVRTYVHRDGKPGIWFFSLDAANWFACKAARAFYHLPYYFASMRTERIGAQLRYRTVRRERPLADLRVDARLGDEQPAASEPGSFEFFLIERYLLYSRSGGRLYSGRVYHPPYPLRSASVQLCEQTLTDTAGFRCPDWEHVCFSDGVDVEVFGLASV